MLKVEAFSIGKMSEVHSFNLFIFQLTSKLLVEVTDESRTQNEIPIAVAGRPKSKKPLLLPRNSSCHLGLRRRCGFALWVLLLCIP